MRKIKRIIKYVLSRVVMLYFSIRHAWPVWYAVLNRKARRVYRAHPATLDAVQQRIVRDLKEKGIAITHLDELFPGERFLGMFQKYVADHEGQAKTKGTKPFLKYFFDPVPEMDFSDPFFRFAGSSRILDIVNAYIDMCAQFYFISLNRTLPVEKGILPTKSQRWHRDFEDKKMCKMFIYLTDVDEGAGPFIYVERSQFGNYFGREFPQWPPLGSYPPTEEVERRIPRDAMKTYTGPAGTIVFCDTSGLHRGGYATAKERIMFTAGYRTEASPSETRYRLSDVAKKEVEALPADSIVRNAFVVRPNSFALKLFKRWTDIPEYY